MAMKLKPGLRARKFAIRAGSSAELIPMFSISPQRENASGMCLGSNISRTGASELPDSGRSECGGEWFLGAHSSHSQIHWRSSYLCFLKWFGDLEDRRIALSTMYEHAPISGASESNQRTRHLREQASVHQYQTRIDTRSRHTPVHSP